MTTIGRDQDRDAHAPVAGDLAGGGANGTEEGRGAAGRGRRPLLLLAVLAVVALVVGAVAVGLARRDDGTASTPTPAPTAAPVPAPPVVSPPPAATVSPPTAPPGTTTSAADELRGFFAAAELSDAALRAAAVRVNAGIGTDTVTIDEQTVRAVADASPERAGTLMWAGMPPKLLTAVLKVYSDLEWRWAAMQCVRTPGTWPRSDAGENLPPGCLGDATVPAQRFAEDLAAARAEAAATPAVGVVRPDSHALPEIGILHSFVNTLNAGCAGRGGYRVTELPVIEWLATPVPGTTDQPANVRVTATRPTGPDAVLFRATYEADRGSWTVATLAC